MKLKIGFGRLEPKSGVYFFMKLTLGGFNRQLRIIFLDKQPQQLMNEAVY